MNERDLPPLDDDVRELLRRASRVGPAPADSKARVIAHLEGSVGPPGGGGGSGIGRTWTHGAATFLLGGALGAAATYGAMRGKESSPTARIVYVDRPAAATAAPSRETPTPPSVPAGDPSPAPPSGPSPFVRASPALTSASAAAGTLEGLNAERALLDVARGALEGEDGAAALVALEEHRRKYPAGVLVQERDAMAIHALVMLGRTSEAQARAAGFRKRFPDSALLPTIDSVVRAASTP